MTNGASPKGPFTSRLPSGAAASSASRPALAANPGLPARPPSGSGSQAQAQGSAVDKASLEKEVQLLAKDLLDLHKSVRQSADPAAHSLSPEAAASILTGEVQRTTSTLLRVVAAASGTPRTAVDRLVESSTVRGVAAGDARLGEMEGWMKEMKAQMLSMQNKQAELLRENKKLREEAEAAKREMLRSVEQSQQGFLQGLGGAVRAELTSDINQRISSAIGSEAINLANNVVYKKIEELTAAHNAQLGVAWDEGRDTGYQEAANGIPYSGPAPQQMQQYGQDGPAPPPPPPPPPPGHGYASPVPAPAPSSKSSQEFVPNAGIDKFINEKLSKFGDKIAARSKKHFDMLIARVYALESESKTGSRSLDASPSGATPQLESSRKRSRPQDEGQEADDTNLTAADMSAEILARKTLAEEVSKVKQELERLHSQVEAAQAQVPTPAPVTSTPAPSTTSLTNYITKFAHEAAIEEISDKISELEKASKKTNDRMREQKDNLKDEVASDLEEVKSGLERRIATTERSITRVESNQTAPMTTSEIITAVDTRLEGLAVNTLETRLTDLALEVNTLDERVATFESDLAANAQLLNEDQDALAAFRQTYDDDYRAMEQLTKQMEANLPGQIAQMLEGMDLREKVEPVVKDEVAAWAADDGVQRLMQPGMEELRKEVEKRAGALEVKVASHSELITENKNNLGRLELRHTSHEQARLDTNSQLAKLDVSLRKIAVPMQTMINVLSNSPSQPQPQAQPQTQPQQASPRLQQGQASPMAQQGPPPQGYIQQLHQAQMQQQ